MSLHQRLIDLYGSGRIRDIEGGSRFAQLCQKHKDDAGFEPERLRIRKLRANLEELLERGLRHADQVKSCLRLLGEPQQQKDRADYHQLIEIAYYRNWSRAQRQHYDSAYVVISGNILYFLSFTNRNNTPGDPNVVNTNHLHFIKDVFYNRDILSDAEMDPSKYNLLAKAVWWFLRSKGLEGFYYPTREGDSDYVYTKLVENCGKAMTFVQLVHHIMFEWREDNYCQLEYAEVIKSSACKKRIYVLAEERNELLPLGVTVSHSYKSWYDEVIEEKDALELTPSILRDDAVIMENRRRIKKSLLDQIVRLRNEIFENVPEG